VSKLHLKIDDSEDENELHKVKINYYDECSARGPTTKTLKSAFTKTDLQVLEDEFPQIPKAKVEEVFNLS